MWVQPVLSVASSKRPSGVPAELERLLLGDAAMAVAFGATRPGHATKWGCFSHAGHARSAASASLFAVRFTVVSICGVELFGCEDEMWNWLHRV